MKSRKKIPLLVLFLAILISSSTLSQSYARPTSLSHHINRIADGIIIAFMDMVGSPADRARVRLNKAEHLTQEIEDLPAPSEEDIEENEQYANDVVETLGEVDNLIDEACERDRSEETLRHRDRVRIRAENATRRALEVIERNIERYREKHPDKDTPPGLLRARERLQTAHSEQERKRKQERRGQGEKKGKETVLSPIGQHFLEINRHLFSKRYLLQDTGSRRIPTKILMREGPW